MLSTSKALFRNPTGGGPTPTDPSFAYVPLLLNTTSTNGQQNNTFIDTGPYAFPITRNGTPTQGSITPYWPNGQWSNYFVRASTQYLTVSNAGGQFSFGTGALTIECWINPVSLPSASGYPGSYWIFGGGPASNNPGIDFYLTPTQIGFNLSNFTSPTAIGNHGMVVNNWYHVAVVRGGPSNQTVSIYVNGTRVATASSVTDTADAASTGISISAAEPSGATSGNFDGYISNYRVVKGSAVYDPTLSTLTVPTSPLTAVTNTQLLTCYSNRFIDANTATTAKTITVNGTPTVQAFQPFSPTASYTTALYGGSGYFGGSDYLNAGTSSAFIIGTGDFTIELWVYLISYGNTYTGFFTTRVGGQGMDIQILNSGATLMLGNSSGAIISANSVVPFNAWTHICGVRSGNSNSLYVNGTRVATGTDSTNFTDNGAKVGTSGPSGGSTNTAYMSNVRFVKGTAVYSPSPTTITVPTAPVTAVVNTSLLTNFTNAGIYDAAAQNVITTVGGAQASTTITAQFPPTSMKFDGTGDWLTAIDNPQLQLGTGDFTIEGWFYLTANGTAYGIVSKGAASTGWSVNVTSGNRIQFSYTAANLTGATTTLAASTWYYFAVVRSGSATGNLKIYINGALEVTSGGAVTDNFNQTNILYVGASRTGTTPLNGYLQDIRITTAARTITASPTAPFPTR